MHHIGFVMEQALGHVTHTRNLQALIQPDEEINTHWILPEWEGNQRLLRLPNVGSNWTLQAGTQAREGLAALSEQVRLDALFFHTQITAVLAPDWVRRIPSIISLDATPEQYDELGEHYAHGEAPVPLEWLKKRLYRYVFGQAQHLVTWSEWAKGGLADYGVPADKVTVIPPGVHVSEWRRPTPRRLEPERPARILFVGGDLERKGGLILLEAFRHLRRVVDVELHLVTRSRVDSEAGVYVYNDMEPNTARLKELYFGSDIFCLPTYGDCLPMVLSEAAAAGLPQIATDVAAIPEIVRDGVTGYLVPREDVTALYDRLHRLVDDPELRLRQSEQATRWVAEHYDAARNAARLVSLLKQVAGVSEKASRKRVLLTVSGEIPDKLASDIVAGRRPLTDYVAMAARFGADLLDTRRAVASAGPAGPLLHRIFGSYAMLAWACFRLRREYDTVFTDGEQVGLPLAALLKYFNRGRRPRHVMIAHILSVPKKETLLDRLRLQSEIDTFVVYATWQKRFIESRWQVPSQRVVFTPFMVDSHFFSPEQISAQDSRPDAVADLQTPLICAVGLERRDYPTLLEAVRDLDVQVVVAAASPWSRQTDSTSGETIPPNVTVRKFTQFELRHLYALSAFMVMPLLEVDFQAGVTAILEAMAMERAVVCTRTPGQTDIVVDGETGLYVPPADPEALRKAICELLEDPVRAQQMGKAGRQRIVNQMSLVHYVDRLAAHI